MAKPRRIYGHVVGVGVLNKDIFQGLPCAALVYLYFRLYALVARVVRETVHRYAHLLTADLQARVPCVVKRLTALYGNVNGNQLHVARGGLARSVGGYGLQIGTACVGGNARKVKLEVEGFKR